jgi:hypothetical protein
MLFQSPRGICVQQRWTSNALIMLKAVYLAVIWSPH